MSCVVDFKSPDGLWVGSYRLNGQQIKTRSYTIWHNIKTRCNVGGNYQNKRPTYKGCTNYFSDYQFFADWCQHQIGYMEVDVCGRYWALDKDILNTTEYTGYSPETCCFVPIELNGLLQIQVSNQNSLPLGVIKRDRKTPFSAQINIDGKNKHLGCFKSEYEAHKVWQSAKYDRICAMVVKYQGLVDKRVIDRLNLIGYNLVQDINLNRETIDFGGVPLAA